MSLKGSAAITGFAELPSTKNPEGLTSLAIQGRMAREAVEDAGFHKSDIDGLLVSTPADSFSLFWPTVFGETLGLKLRYFDNVEIGGASAAGMIWRAAAAIQAGMCRNVLCVTASVSKGGASSYGALAPRSREEFDTPYGLGQPNSGYAMIARRHMHEFGTTPEQLAKIAVDQRTNALKNPMAMFNKSPLTIDQVLNSPMVLDPLHMFEIVSRCTGGAAIVVSGRDLAKRSKNPPVWLLGAGEAGTHMSISQRKDFTTSWVKDSAASAFRMSGVTSGQMDFIQVYDCYTITVLVSLEDMGFCAKGQGGPMVMERDLTWCGDMPVNTNGGQLSAGQAGSAGGMGHIVEAARQLMGRGGERQVKDATLGIGHGNGGVMGDQVTLVLANQ
ncbi:MAG TPA: thiolase family protein [Bryobacteraceae bacterium]|jgi:acetyl-CoA acetyltransferase|nr:thiolase family protein [Bryobacteraceae bacterium]